MFSIHNCFGGFFTFYISGVVMVTFLCLGVCMSATYICGLAFLLVTGSVFLLFKMCIRRIRNNTGNADHLIVSTYCFTLIWFVVGKWKDTSEYVILLLTFNNNTLLLVIYSAVKCPRDFEHL